jgi:voltage-gated potassium channel
MFTNALTLDKAKRNRPYKLLKKKVYLLLDPADGGTFWDRVVNGIIISLILLNLLAVCLETVESLYHSYRSWFNNFELFSITIFTIEYLLRVWSCTSIQIQAPG